MRKLLFSIIISSMLCSFANAENLYVRPVNDCTGAPCGAHDGSNWANAFNGFADVSWGSGDGKVGAGDTLYISGGATSATYTREGAAGTGILTIGAAGTEGNPITITVDTSDPNHDGTAIFQCTAEDAIGGKSNPYGISCGYGYIVISGVDSNRRIKITNCLTTGSDPSYGFGIEAFGTGGVIIEYIEVDASSNGVALSSYGSVLRNSYLHDIRGDKGIKTGDTGASSYNRLLIHDNTVQVNVDASGYGPDGVSITQDGVSVYNNILYGDTGTVIGNQHNDMIQNSANYTKVYSNHFYDCHDSCFDYDMYHTTTPGYIMIYNNVFDISISHFRDGGEHPLGFRFYHSNYLDDPVSFNDIYILNNNFIDWSTGSSGKAGGIDLVSNCNIPAEAITNIHIKNNIFYNSGTLSEGTPVFNICHPTATSATLAKFNIDYNVMYSGIHGNNEVDICSAAACGGGCTTFTTGDWGETLQAHGKYTQPLFTSYTEDSASTNNYVLLVSDTSAKDSGTDLSLYFNTDKDGNTRLGTWDIGAYEYTEGGSTQTTSGITIQGVQIQ